MLSDDAIRLLRSGAIGHLATLMPGGEPKVEPVWVDADTSCDPAVVLVATDEGSIKAANTRRDGRVALSVTAVDDPYEQLLVRGRVAERRSDDDLAVLDALSDRYLGRPFPRRTWGERVVLAIEPGVVRYGVSGLSSIAREHRS